MSMAEIGAAWWRQRLDKDKNPVMGKDGKPVWNLSISLELPFLGQISFTLIPNEDASKNERAPAFKAVWWPPRKDEAKKTPSSSSGPPDGGPSWDESQGF